MTRFLNGGFFVSVCLLMGGLYLAVFMGFSPQLLQLGLITTQTQNTVLSIFPIVALVSGITSMAVLILSGVGDALFSRNDKMWKVKWVAVILVFQLIGLVAYYMIGCKTRKEEALPVGKKRK